VRDGAPHLKKKNIRDHFTIDDGNRALRIYAYRTKAITAIAEVIRLRPDINTLIIDCYIDLNGVKCLFGSPQVKSGEITKVIFSKF